MIYVEDIRVDFIRKLHVGEYVQDKTGQKMLEIVGASFVADKPAIFGTPNEDYIQRELKWYESQSLNVNDIEGSVPAAWKAAASSDGWINSNYGWMIYSNENWNQYERVREELIAHPYSRRAVMIYTRPSIWSEYDLDGMSDFICTNAVQYLIRDGQLEVVVQMRSNDAWSGYRNDYAWALYVQKKLASELGIALGKITWQAGSFHVYQKDFYLVDHCARSGEISIKKSEYKEKYPDSPWAK